MQPPSRSRRSTGVIAAQGAFVACAVMLQPATADVAHTPCDDKSVCEACIAMHIHVRKGREDRRSKLAAVYRLSPTQVDWGAPREDDEIFAIVVALRRFFLYKVAQIVMASVSFVTLVNNVGLVAVAEGGGTQ